MTYFAGLRSNLETAFGLANSIRCHKAANQKAFAIMQIVDQTVFSPLGLGFSSCVRTAAGLRDGIDLSRRRCGATLNHVCQQKVYPITIRAYQRQRVRAARHGALGLPAQRHAQRLRPRKPTDDLFIEAFNGRFRAECWNTHWFLTFADAVETLKDWIGNFNEQRLHGAIGNKVPIMVVKWGDDISPSP